MSLSGPFRLALALLPLVLLLASGPARASNTADEADVAFSLGNRAYAHRDFEEALSQYFISYRLVPNQNVLFNIARCYEALGRVDEAYRYYADLSALSLAVADRHEVTAALARLRSKVALLEVTSTPPGADVFIDRTDLGSRGHTPLVLALPPGTHKVSLRKDGYQDAEGTASLLRGQRRTRTLPLTLITGEVAIDGSPRGAEIRESESGPVLATVPGTVALPPGKRLLWVSAPGRAPAQLLVDVVAKKTAHLSVALAERALATGKVVVTANRDGALVEVDGREAGFTPTVLTLPVGEHTITVSTRELTPVEEKVAVSATQERALHAELRYRPPAVQAASKSLASVDEAPASITVITADEIRAFGYTTLAQALSAVRGIYLSDDRQYTYVGIRGFSPPGDLNTRILILWDGHAMNDVWAGQGYAARDLSVDLSEVERIEVVRGPGSALYGTGAFFAVINVVPRSHLSAHRNVELTGTAGGENGWGGHAAAGMTGTHGTFLASASGFGATGAPLTDLGPLGQAQGMDRERAWDANARYQDGPFTLQARINTRIKDIPTAPYGTAPNLAGTRVHDTRGFAEARYESGLGQGALSVRGYYDGSRYNGHWEYLDPGGRLLETDSGAADWVGGEARYRFGLFGHQTLTVGTEAQVQMRVDQSVFGAGDAPPLATQRRTQLSAYLLDEWRPSPRFSVSAGLRVDHYLDLNATPVTPRLALIGKPYANGVTKLVAGQAFRAPDVYELYYGDNELTQRPALTLQPETITTVELEHAHDLTEELRLTVAGYHNRISQLVVLGTDTGTPACGSPGALTQCLVYKNAADVLSATGVEAELRWQPGRFALVDLSYSYVTLSGGSGALETGTPHHLAAARVLTPLGDSGVRLSTQATYQSGRPQLGQSGLQGEALLWDVGISGELEHLRYFAGVKNLLDERYALPVGSEFSQPTVPQYGRTFLLQLTAGF